MKTQYAPKGKTEKKKPIPRQLSFVNIGRSFPAKMQMSHRYSGVETLSCTSGAVNTYKWAANGMYDPNISAAGHQPYYFDQLAALYNHYTVISSTVTMTFLPVNSAQGAMIVCVADNDDSTVGNAGYVSNQIEQTNSKYVTLPTACAVGQVIRHSYDAKKIFGADALANDNLQGTGAANPTELWCWIISMQAMDGAASPSMYFVIVIQYTAVWDELKDVTSS